jgi:hypothetical protein
MKHARAECVMIKTPARAAKMYKRVNAARVLIGLSPLEKRELCSPLSNTTKRNRPKFRRAASFFGGFMEA